MFTDISGEHAATIFRAKEDGSSMFLPVLFIIPLESMLLIQDYKLCCM
jgi:hypothetical protein